MLVIDKLKKIFWFIFNHRIKVFFLWITIATGAISLLGIYLWSLQTQITLTNLGLSNIENKLSQYEMSYENFLFSDHLGYLENLNLNKVKQEIETEFAKLQSEESSEKLTKIENIYTLYQDFLSKVERNGGSNLSTTEQTDKLDDWGKKLLEQDYDGLTSELTENNKKLDQDYQTYLASLQPVAPPTPAPTITPTSTPTIGYNYQYVQTSRGSFSAYVIKLPLSSYTVKTVTANTNNCTNDCPTKTLSTYINENNAYAGINGTYFCPPDYTSCAGKTNTYDFAVYNSDSNKWLNQNALYWNSVGIALFNNSTPTFYQNGESFGGETVTAGITNFPPLVVTDNKVTIDETNLTTYQKDVKGLRGALGVDESNIYLAIISGANLTDMAYVMKELGATNVLNLDGGGSAALYINGSYKVGPGRSLPNAILLIKN